MSNGGTVPRYKPELSGRLGQRDNRVRVIVANLIVQALGIFSRPEAFEFDALSLKQRDHLLTIAGSHKKFLTHRLDFISPLPVGLFRLRKRPEGFKNFRGRIRHLQTLES